MDTGNSDSPKPTSTRVDGTEIVTKRNNLNNNSSEVRQKSRPVSLYDNLKHANGTHSNNGIIQNSNKLNNGGDTTSGHGLNLSSSLSASEQNISSKKTNFSNVGDDVAEFQKYTFDRSPSQAIYLSTTVPQNMAAHAIAGRHTPTRNSLRHSRMIVMSRCGKVPHKYLPPVLRCARLAQSLCSLQMAVGVAITALALWLLLWAPSTPARHNPYWSGIALTASGFLGLLLFGCCRKEYPGMPKEYCVASFKVISIMTSLLAAVLCFTACFFAAVQIITLSNMACESANVVNATCICRRMEDTSITETNQLLTPSTAPTHSDTEFFHHRKSTIYHYRDMNCAEVKGVWNILMIVSSILNAIGAILCLVYVYLYWAGRKDYLYSKVKTRENIKAVTQLT